MRKKLMGAAISAVIAAPAMADDHSNKWYLNAGVGYQVFDSAWDLDETAAGLLSIEKQISKNWGVEVGAVYSESDNSYDVAARDAEYLSLSVSALRYYNIENNDRLTPYAAIGLGDAYYNFEAQDDQGITTGNVGGGLRYALSGPLSLRADARYYYGFDTETDDGIVSLGLSYAFGGESKPAPAPAPVQSNDSDADGVEDGADQCPGTPAGVAVDAKGCALDKDGDGVPNYRDKCPNTPAGRQVDKFGCKFVLKHTESIKMDVKFPLNSDAIPASQISELKKVAEFMKRFGGVKAVVEGHSDSTGAAAYNKQLSQRRADAVRSALIKEFGIDASRLSAIGYGEERPIADNSTKAGRQANRRVVAVMEAEVAK